MALSLKVVGAGQGGLDEMRSHLAEDSVQFGLLKFAVGSGTFQRTKLLFVHFNGENCSGVKKGRINGKKGAVIQACGATHAELPMEKAEECTLEGIWEKLSKVFVSDDGKFTISQFKADYERMIQEARMRALGKDDRKRKTAKEMGITDSDKILAALRKPTGPFKSDRWALFTPKAGKPELYNAGSGSVEEMIDWLKQDEVLAGLIRMGFGKGRFRRTKWISVWWSGEEVAAVKRGRANQLQGELLTKIGPFSLTVQATHLEEITLPIIIDKVKKASVVDGETANSDDGADPYSMEAFLAALKEEMEENAEFFGDNTPSSSSEEKSFEEIIKLTRADNGPYNWSLFTVV